MSFLKNLFGSRTNVASLLVNAQNQIFELYEVSQPTDAQKLRSLFYLGVAGLAILNDVGQGSLNDQMDKLVEGAGQLANPLSVRVGALVDGKEELGGLLKGFPAQANVNAQTLVNGHAAFGALYATRGELMMSKILEKRGNPQGMAGSAAIVVGDGIFGPGRGRDHFVLLSMLVFEFAKEMKKA